MSEQWRVDQINANSYHGDAWQHLNTNSSWKLIFISLGRALLAIDVRLAELVAIEKERNDYERTNNRITRFAKQIQQGKQK